LNFDYEVCNSLSRYWIVPKTINDTLLKHAARFRARNRLPTLSYVHNDKIVLIRSSQPLCGLGYKRSVQDEKLVREFTIGTDLVIIDARSAASAFANAMTGKGGSELESHYNAKKRIFLNLDNVHYVRRAEQEIFENNNSIDWISLLNKLLVAAFVIAEEMIIGGNSVLLHCSDGWDRTAQLVSLVQILLDRRYRTKKGLATLIEKEWLGAGHQFSKRMGIQSDPHEIEEQGNVFGQFINILWIFWKSQPTCFEWNESILEEIWKEACDPDGYFNGDNERIRVIRENIWNILEHSGKLSSLDIDKLKRVEMLPFYPSMRLFQP
jgi:myotubularin-related protein 1/2